MVAVNLCSVLHLCSELVETVVALGDFIRWKQMGAVGGRWVGSQTQSELASSEFYCAGVVASMTMRLFNMLIFIFSRFYYKSFSNSP
jgi:hypothetical protein